MPLIDMSECYQMTNVGDHIDGTDVYQSNPNLLDNPFFRINQRQATSGTTTTYIADRWLLTFGSGGVTWSRTNETITVQSTSGTSHADIYQNIEPSLFADLVGKTVTLSVMLNDYSILSKTFEFPSNANRSGDMGFGLDGNNIRYVVYYASKRVELQKSLTAETYRAVKLELGSVSTLANDTPPDYGTELIKCRGYFERIHSLGSSEIVGMGMGVSASSVRIGIPSLICHTIQSVTYSGGGLLLEGGGDYRTLTSIGRLNATPKNGFLTVTCGSSDAITLYQTYALVGTAAGGYIDISADL